MQQFRQRPSFGREAAILSERFKFVLIGAGSTVFTQRLVSDLILSGEAHRWELALVDIDPVTLKAVDRLVHKMLAFKGVEFPIVSTTNRREVLPGADFVVTTIAVGGRRGWELDVQIPRKHQIFQPVGDTAMPGGISRAMRMIPQMVAIAHDIAELCPDAYFLNYSNPMTAICRAIRMKTGVPVTGLCHGVHYVEGVLARFLGVSGKQHHQLRSRPESPHFSNADHVRWEGRDVALPSEARRAASNSGEGTAGKEGMAEHDSRPAALFRRPVSMVHL